MKVRQSSRCCRLRLVHVYRPPLIPRIRGISPMLAERAGRLGFSIDIQFTPRFRSSSELHACLPRMVEPSKLGEKVRNGASERHMPGIHPPCGGVPNSDCGRRSTPHSCRTECEPGQSQPCSHGAQDPARPAFARSRARWRKSSASRSARSAAPSRRPQS